MGDDRARTKNIDALDDPVPPSAPTVRPPFDPLKLAEEAVRPPAPTITDEVATEEARITSVLMDSKPPRAPSASAPDLAVKLAADLDVLSPEEQRAVIEDRLAPLQRVPHLTRPFAELGPMLEDPQTAYVLGFVDGLLPLETIVDVAGLPELDTLKILHRALDHGAIYFKQR